MNRECLAKCSSLLLWGMVTMMMMTFFCLVLNIPHILLHLSFAIIHWGRIISPTLEIRNWVSEVNGLPKSLKYVSDSLDCIPSLYIIVMLTFLFLERVVFSRLDHWCPKHYLPTVPSFCLYFFYDGGIVGCNKLAVGVILLGFFGLCLRTFSKTVWTVSYGSFSSKILPFTSDSCHRNRALLYKQAESTSEWLYARVSDCSDDNPVLSHHTLCFESFPLT